MSRNPLASARLRHVFAAGAVLGLGVGGAGAQALPATRPDNPDDVATLKQQVRQLSAKVDALQSKQDLDQAQVSAAISQLIQDADAQSKLISTEPLMSGYDPSVGFVIRSDDGNFSLHPGIVMDFRYDANYREKIPAGGGGTSVPSRGYDVENGFDIARFRMLFSGNFTQNITYYVQLQDDEGTTFGLFDAYFTYHLGDESPLYLRVGQFKDPVWHERNISEANLMAVDRTLVEYLLAGGQGSRVQGASLIYDRDRLRAQLATHDGFDSINTSFFDTGGVGTGVGGESGVTPPNYGVSGRGEFLLIGDRTPGSDAYAEYDSGFTALGLKQNYLVAGAGMDYTEADRNNLFTPSADLTFDTTSGVALYAAYYGTIRDLKDNQGIVPGNYYDNGFEAQAAYLVTRRIEPFARFDYVYLAPGSLAGQGIVRHSVQEITVGANYYIYKQNAKITVDGSYLPNGSPTDANALGILKDTGRNEFVLRAQFQLAL
jgi:hypothetical protein